MPSLPPRRAPVTLGVTAHTTRPTETLAKTPTTKIQMNTYICSLSDDTTTTLRTNMKHTPGSIAKAMLSDLQVRERLKPDATWKLINRASEDFGVNVDALTTAVVDELEVLEPV